MSPLVQVVQTQFVQIALPIVITLIVAAWNNNKRFDESIRTFVSTFLTQSGYNVMLAESGEDALQQSTAYKPTIHLLLSNVQMPGMTGMELGAKLSLERPDLRVMLMSGFTSGLLVLNEGWHFLHKPFIPSQMRDLVASVLAPTDPMVIPNLDEHKPRQPK